MHRMRHRLRQPAIAAIAASSLMAMGLAACGGSSGSSTTATQANASATSPASTAKTGGGATGDSGATGATGRTAPRGFSAVRECLQRNGVKLPANGGGGRPFPLGAANGANSGKLRSAMRKCLGVAGFTRVRRGQGFRANNPRFKQALADFANCMRKNGVNVPAPNTSGNGPVFSSKGLNTTSPQFKAAAAKCRPRLSGSFRGAPATGQPTG